MSAKESIVTRAITIRTDEATLELLESLASTSERSRNYLANRALREFLERESASGGRVETKVPVAERIVDFRSELWSEDDTDDFLVHLEEERQRSLRIDRLHELK